MNRFFSFFVVLFCALFFLQPSFSQNWASELGECWDALERDSSAREKFKRYNEIADALKAGKIALSDELDEEQTHEKWLSALKDFEEYWSSHCPRTFSVTALHKFATTRTESVEYFEDVIGEDGKTKRETRYRTEESPAWEYQAWISSGFSLKYVQMLSIFQNGLRRARKADWTDIPKNWPFASAGESATLFTGGGAKFAPAATEKGVSLYDVRFDVVDGSSVLLSGKRALSGGAAVFSDVDQAKSAILDEAIAQGRVSYILREVVLLFGETAKVSITDRDWISSMSEKAQDVNSIRFESDYKKLPAERNAVDEAEARAIAEDFMINVPAGKGLSSFFVSKTEVTQRLYKDVMQKNPSNFKGSEKPAESMSWYDALVFCNRLSRICSLKPVYSVDGNSDSDEWDYAPHSKGSILGKIDVDFGADGFRLPSEEEWLFLARGNSDEESDYAGEDADSAGWHKKNARGKTQIVGEKSENSLGLFDVTGNVWEWCFDVADETGFPHVAHGGAWNYDPRYCKINDKYIRLPHLSFNCLGIRLVRGQSGSHPKTEEDFQKNDETQNPPPEEERKTYSGGISTIPESSNSDWVDAK